MPAIWWARRDLRLGDNPALSAALEADQLVLPLFIIDPQLMNRYATAERRVAFLLRCLANMDAELCARGSRLLVRRGEPLQVLQELVRETGAEHIYAEHDVWPYGRQRDARIAQDLPLDLVDGVTLLPSGSVLKDDGQPYTVYTPYSRRWHETLETRGGLASLPSRCFLSPERLPPIPHDLDSESLEQVFADFDGFIPSEVEANRRLEAWFEGNPAPVDNYDIERNRLDLDRTSTLSPYLRWGMVSVRRCFAKVAERCAQFAGVYPTGLDTWVAELVWREFFQDVLYHFPRVITEPFKQEYGAIEWLHSPMELDAWKHGMTGYPVVDACMRQLLHTGWMHNRGRMIVASFLTKDLLIDWHEGEAWFMTQLLDADPAANNGGWQWTAGTGTDAAPYFRIFNPILQGKKFDPEGVFVRTWVPELENVSTRYIHEPWRMSGAEQQRVGCHIGKDYPVPIVDHKIARQRTLDAYVASREHVRQQREVES